MRPCVSVARRPDVEFRVRVLFARTHRLEQHRGVRLLFENLPPSLASEREVLARCLEAMNGVMPLRAVYLFVQTILTEGVPLAAEN